VKVDLVWPECIDFDLDNNSGSEDVFWVEFEYNEARGIVLPWLKRHYPRKVKKIAAEIEENHRVLDRSHVNSHTKNLWKKGYVYFLISRKLNLIKPMPHYFPYSGLWNADNPFIKIFPQIIYELEDIETIDSTPVKIKELPTWAGCSKFGYIGSVEQGVIIYYGKGRQIKIRPSQFAEMLGCFAGKTVKVGTSSTDRPIDSLESWLKENVTKSAIVSYVAPILIAEGLAEKDNDPTMLRFTDRFTAGELLSV
jgi:hypothetical protein